MSASGHDADIDENWLISWSEESAVSAEEISSSFLFNSDSSFWSGEFLPPPPRPPYLEDQISPDGLTTCDLCTWALERYSETDTYSTGIQFGLSSHLTFILITVSLLSALVGAIVMIVLMHCKSRINSQNSSRSIFSLGRRRSHHNNLTLDVRENDSNFQNSKHFRESEITSSEKNQSKLPGQSWLLLNRVRKGTPTRQLTNTMMSTTPAASNHYTVEDGYTSIHDDAVYTELDRISTPAYQNTGYVLESDNEPVSSAPSSAYYSDISSNDRDRGYEAVGGIGQPMNSHSDQLTTICKDHQNRRLAGHRLSAIRENAILHSNYI